MMAAILNSAIFDSAMLHKTLTQTSSVWLKLNHSDSTWWRQPSWILSIMDSAILHKKISLIHSDSTWWLQLFWNLPSSIQPFCRKRTSFIHSHSTWWRQPSWTLPSWIQLFCTKKTSSSLIHSDSTWWWQPSWILPCWIQRLPSWIQMTCYLLSDSLKNTLTPFWLWLKLLQCRLKLIHSHLTWCWQSSWIWPYWIQPS